MDQKFIESRAEACAHYSNLMARKVVDIAQEQNLSFEEIPLALVGAMLHVALGLVAEEKHGKSAFDMTPEELVKDVQQEAFDKMADWVNKYISTMKQVSKGQY